MAVDTGVLYCNDNLERLAALPDECVDLVYLDPPFFSNRVYEVIWGDEAEVRSFEDRWEGGILHYVGWMKERAVEMARVLKPTGAIYLHCDPHASHYLKVMMDEVFHPRNFLNEVIWKRSSAHSSAKRFAPVHDTILYYAKGRGHTWNPAFQPIPQDTVDAWYNNVEPGTGRRFNRADLTAAGPRSGSSGSVWRGIDPTAKNRHWAIPSFVGDFVKGLDTAEALDALDAAGRLFWPKKRGGQPMLKRYLDESPGIPALDVVTDIQPLNNVTAERLGYPTQKPEALLERLIAASSNPGDVVLDPFCGCGTTVAVAERLGRQWIGVDISATAIEIMRRRLWNQARLRPVIVDMPDTEEALRRLKPFEFQNYVVNALHGEQAPKKVGDMGIDGYWFFTRDPIQVKQSDHVGRPVLDEFETAMRRAKANVGYVVAFTFTKGAVEEVARVQAQEGMNIRLIRVKELLMMTRRPGNPLAKLGPQPEGDVIPLPAQRKPKDMPSAAELVASDKQATTA